MRILDGRDWGVVSVSGQSCQLDGAFRFAHGWQLTTLHPRADGGDELMTFSGDRS